MESGSNEDERIYSDGTSLATAYITGAISILLSNYPNLSPVDVKKILKESSQKLELVNGIYGDFGLLDIKESLNMAKQYEDLK